MNMYAYIPDGMRQLYLRQFNESDGRLLRVALEKVASASQTEASK
jgi:hypothetical protein